MALSRARRSLFLQFLLSFILSRNASICTASSTTNSNSSLFALAPFQSNSAWYEELVAATQSRWPASYYQGQQPPSYSDASALAISAQNYQQAIKDLLKSPKGGRYSSESGSWHWNSPATGGVVLTVFGIGFGYAPSPCTAAELSSTPCQSSGSPPCLYVDASLGQTKGQNVTWTSDSSLTLISAPGLSYDLTVNVTAGRCMDVRSLANYFSYDAPYESQISPANAAPYGLSAMTVFGKNFGTFPSTTVDVMIGDSKCIYSSWVSDSTVVCNAVPRGTGSAHNVRVDLNRQPLAAAGRRSENPKGLANAFSYDKPEVYGISPNNGPPGGFEAVTILGRNFGWGSDFNPILMSQCDYYIHDGEYILFDEQQPSQCITGFNIPGSGRFYVGQEIGSAPVNITWWSILPFSLAHDPIACAKAEFRRSVLNAGDAAAVKLACRDISDRSIPRSNSFVVNQCPSSVSSSGEVTYVPCPAHVVSGYVKDGVSCETKASSGTSTLFEANQIFANAYLCKMTPKQSCPACQGTGCCNNPGTFGASIAHSQCITLRWVSDSSLVCRTPPGIGAAHTVTLALDDTAGSQIAQLSNAFSFDAPTITSASPVLSPTTGNLRITAFGRNFGTLECNSTWCSRDRSMFVSSSEIKSVKLSAQQSACSATEWLSDSVVVCTTSPGLGASRALQLTVGTTFAAWNGSGISFAAPAISSLHPASARAVGESSITIYGLGFGAWDSSARARLGDTACVASTWTSDSSLVCRAPAGVRSAVCGEEGCGVVVATVVGQAGYASGIFSYKAPAITSLRPFNGPTTGGSRMTILGENFGTTAAYEHVAQIGATSCRQLTWTSDSSISCTVQAGNSRKLPTTLSLAKKGVVASNASVAFSYDRPYIAQVSVSNIPSTGNIDITIKGQNFGSTNDPLASSSNADVNALALVGHTACASTTWLSDSQLICKISSGTSGPGVGGQIPLQVVRGQQSGVYMRELGYFPPQVLYPSDVNGPAMGENTITIIGNHYGVHDYSPKASVGDSSCSATRWLSNSAVSCVVPRCTTFLAGANLNLPVAVQVGSGDMPETYQSGSVDSYTYDLPFSPSFVVQQSEWDVAVFGGSLLLASLLIAACHIYSLKRWTPRLPSLPSQYARLKNRHMFEVPESRKAPAIEGLSESESEAETERDQEQGPHEDAEEEGLMVEQPCT
mmetsp:Transcript_3543/g.12453  ORF Transcript_3543/g.12453 Transcript_3543/m.12453 type:complete len:1186 (-) Transcript_3543:1318-4875(-)